MAISLNGGTGIITGVSVGGLPDGIVDTDMLAAGAVTAAKRGAGAVLQVVNVLDGDRTTTTALFPLDDTKPQNTEGAEFITAAITPTSSASNLWINATINLAANPADTMVVALFQDSDADALSSTVSYMTTNNGSLTMTLNHYMTAGTTSQTTFKLRAGGTVSGTIANNGGTTTRYFGGTASTAITIMEIAA